MSAKRIQVDEIWSFVYAKAKNASGAKAAPEGAGDSWTWTAIDADSKLVFSVIVGGRDAEFAYEFMADLVAIVEAADKKLGKRGPYKKRVAA